MWEKLLDSSIGAIIGLVLGYLLAAFGKIPRFLKEWIARRELRAKGIDTEFTFDPSPADIATRFEEVFVAGQMNGWFSSGLRVKDAKKYRLSVTEGGTWRGKLRLLPGQYDFKFLVRLPSVKGPLPDSRDLWIGWRTGSRYECGQPADGGPNFRISVE